MGKPSGKSRGFREPDAQRAARQHRAGCICAGCEAHSLYRLMSTVPLGALPGIPMLLWCPECRARHVDVGDFAEKKHHTHACQTCGHVWRPALVNTVGVQFLPGFKDEAGP